MRFVHVMVHRYAGSSGVVVGNGSEYALMLGDGRMPYP